MGVALVGRGPLEIIHVETMLREDRAHAARALRAAPIAPITSIATTAGGHGGGGLPATRSTCRCWGCTGVQPADGGIGEGIGFRRLLRLASLGLLVACLRVMRVLVSILLGSQ